MSSAQWLRKLEIEAFQLLFNGRVMLEIEWKEDEWEEEKWIFEGELDWKPVLPKSKEI